MKIKICGLTSSKEAAFLNQYQVDYAGMVLFFPKSKRNISLEKAKEIIQALNPTIRKVAVVVSPTLEQIIQIEALGFDFIQIHGPLSEDLLSKIHLPILKAFNVSDLAQYDFYHSCTGIAGYVFDAQTPGSGQTFDWDLLTRIPRDEKMLFLAGGLSPHNMSKAILFVHPDAVDVSSGVEYDDLPGKDPEKIAAFVQQVRSVSL